MQGKCILRSIYVMAAPIRTFAWNHKLTVYSYRVQIRFYERCAEQRRRLDLQRNRTTLFVKRKRRSLPRILEGPFGKGVPLPTFFGIGFQALPWSIYWQPPVKADFCFRRSRGAQRWSVFHVPRPTPKVPRLRDRDPPSPGGAARAVFGLIWQYSLTY